MRKLTLSRLKQVDDLLRFLRFDSRVFGFWKPLRVRISAENWIGFGVNKIPATNKSDATKPLNSRSSLDHCNGGNRKSAHFVGKQQGVVRNLVDCRHLVRFRCFCFWKAAFSVMIIFLSRRRHESHLRFCRLNQCPDFFGAFWVVLSRN